MEDKTIRVDEISSFLAAQRRDRLMDEDIKRKEYQLNWRKAHPDKIKLYNEKKRVWRAERAKERARLRGQSMVTIGGLQGVE